MEKTIELTIKGKLTLVYGILVLSSISLAGLVYNIIQYRDFEALLAKPEVYSMSVMLIVMITFLFHIILQFLLGRLIFRHINYGILGYITLGVGLVSIMSFLFDWGALTDIGKELPMGWEIKNELRTVTMSTTVQVVFTLLTMIIAGSSISEKRDKTVRMKSVDGEKLFASLGVAGVLCGLIGLGLCLFYYMSWLNPQKYKWIVIPFTSFVLLPYLIVLMSWLIDYRKNRKESGIFDEKQIQDLKKAGFVTWILSFPFMFSVFIYNYDGLFGWIGVLWLPIFIFFSLLVFSFLSIWYYKQ